MPTQTKEKIAVCIPTYNQAQFIEASISSALNQIGPYDIQVWVSDDASTDNTEEIVKKICSQDKRINYFRHSTNLGSAENRAWLYKQPQCEFLVNLDSDDILKPEFLTNLVPKLHKYPKAAHAHCLTECIDQNGKIISKRSLFRKAEYLDSETALRELHKSMGTTSTILLFRKKALEDVNFTKNRPRYVDDYDLLVRLADKGYGNIYIKKYLSQYRIWTINNKARNNKNEQIEGLCRIYEESLIPAFNRRGWNLNKVYKEKKAQALNYSICLIENNELSNQEKKKMIYLLKRLGDSFSLRIKILSLEVGLGNLFIYKKRRITKIKNLIKNFLTTLSSS